MGSFSALGCRFLCSSCLALLPADTLREKEGHTSAALADMELLLCLSVRSSWRCLPVASCTAGVAAGSDPAHALGCRLTGCPAWHAALEAGSRKEHLNYTGLQAQGSAVPSSAAAAILEDRGAHQQPLQLVEVSSAPRPLTAALPTGCVLHCHADTDMEAEVEPSVEGEEALRAEEAAAQQRLAQLARWVCVKLLVGSTVPCRPG